MSSDITAAEIEDAALRKETTDLLRFLLRDNAFDVDFLITAVEEYYAGNKPKADALDERTGRTK